MNKDGAHIIMGFLSGIAFCSILLALIMGMPRPTTVQMCKEMVKESKK